MFDISKKAIYKIIQILFGLLMLSVAFTTIFLDKNSGNVNNNSAKYANGGYYLIAFMILVAVYFLHRCISGQSDISKRSYILCMTILPVMVWVVVQLPVGKWIYWYTSLVNDYGSIMHAAIGFNNGESFEDWTYFLTSPNNANLTIVLSWIYKILPDWRHTLILGATLTNISAVFVALAVKNITKSRMASVCALVSGELLMAMTWRAFVVYTDNFGMIFVALIIWVYSLDLADRYKMPIVVILAACGTFIKLTVFICFLAILLHKFCILLKNKNFKQKFKTIVLFGMVSVVAFGLMIFAQELLRNYYGLYLEGEYPKEWPYMFMVGQNNDCYGVFNVPDTEIRSRIIEDAISRNEGLDYVNQQFLSEALQRVTSRGIIGNVDFYIRKLNVAYNDGYFHNTQAPPEMPVSNELEHNIIYDLLEKENGEYYQISAGILQVAWDFVLLLLMLSVLLLRKNDTYKFFEILILGITAYVMLFEGRSKYLYMFLPVFVSAAGMSFAEMDGQLLKLKKAIVMLERNNSNIKRKTVGIITFHFVNNFGGVLQAYALRKVVERECDVEAEIIDYRNWFIRFTDRIRLLPLSSNVKEIISGFKTMKQRIGRRSKFGSFIKDNNKLSKKYLNHWQINRSPLYADKYICGSDQIWNPVLTMGVNSNYFLGFESDSGKKIAYAPSFGTNGVAKSSEKKVKRYLESICSLSVREKSGQELIKEMTGRDVERLIDPTFLLAKEEWEKMGVNPLESDEPYILLYIMQRDIEVYEYARKIKEQMGEKIQLVEISRYGYQPGFVDKALVDVGPAEFLGLFRDAKYICTNSYHGLIYSLIFEKDFCLIPCKRFKARIDNLFDLLEIESITGDNGELLTASYDKKFVHCVIEKERAKAIEFLIESVGNK